MNTTRRALSQVRVWAALTITSCLLAPHVPGLQQPAQAQTEPDTVLERKSKRPFPVQLQVQGSQRPHTLVGTGIRTKTFLKVQVYAFGLYVDVAAATPALSAWAGHSARELARDESFYGELLQGRFGMTLRLVMTRDVSGEDMAAAFDDALGPRVRRAVEELGMSDGEATGAEAGALSEFGSYFNLEELTKETELVFTWLPDGRLLTSVQGTSVGEIESKALSWALFDVYLGDDPISKSAKKTVISRFPPVLTAAQETRP